MGTQRLDVASAAHHRRPIDRVWSVLPFLVPALVAVAAGLRTTDLAYHLRLGDRILGGAGIPTHDTMTFTVPGAPWVDQQWLAQVVLAATERVGGWELLAVLRAVLVGAAFGIVYLTTRVNGARPRTGSLLAIAAFLVAAPALALRPQLLAVTLFAVGLWSVVSSRFAPGRVWLLPLLGWLTANLHGSFPLFVVLAVLALVQDAVERRPLRRATAVLVATLGATFVNPFGVGVWRYVVELSSNPTIRATIEEWRPLALDSYQGIAIVISVVGITVLAVWRRPQLRGIDLVWLGTFLVPAVLTQRAGVWWAMVAAVVGAAWLRDGSTVALPAERASGSKVVAAVVVACVATIAATPWILGVRIEDVPPGMTTAIQGLPRGDVLVHQPWASWVEYATPHRVFVDSRIELFPTAIWDDYDEVAFAGDGRQGALDRWRPDAIVADPESWEIVPLLREDPGWTVADEGDGWVIFVPV